MGKDKSQKPAPAPTPAVEAAPAPVENTEDKAFAKSTLSTEEVPVVTLDTKRPYGIFFSGGCRVFQQDGKDFDCATLKVVAKKEEANA